MWPVIADTQCDATIPATLFLKDALPYVVSSFALFLIGYLLLRWLYFKPLPEYAPSSPTVPE